MSAIDQKQAGRGQAALLIQQRAAAMRDLIRKDPAQAVSFAFSPEVLAELAAEFPELASQLEAHGSWQGTVEHWMMDSANLTPLGSATRLHTANGTLDLYFASCESGLTSGSTVTVSGVRLGAMAAVSSTATEATATSLTCSTTGVQNIAVLLVTFPGVTPPTDITPQSMRQTFFGTTGRSLNGFWQEASYGKTSAAGDVYGYYTLDRSYTCTEASQMRDAAIAMAAAQGANFQNYTRIFVIYPNIGCTAGFAQVGCSTLNSPSGSFTASSAYIEVDFMTGDSGVQLATHEGGHNLGLQHGGTLDFGTETLGPLSATGTVNEFGDYWSTMGSQALGHYPAPQKASVLKWLDPGTNYQVVQSSGTWTLQPLETSPAGLQALKVQRGTGNNAWLWVEYRQPLGNYDSTLMTEPFGGALIHYEDSTTGAATRLLNFTPDGAWDTWWSPSLAAGKTWTDPYSNVSISVQGATASGLTVSVSYGASSCAHANPSVSVSPLNPSSPSGGSVVYTVAVKNNDSAGCAAGAFTLSSSQPSGWSYSFSPTYLTLSPGQTGSVSLTKNVPASALAGVYTVDVSATQGTFTASGLANVTVSTAPALTMSLSPSSATYTVRQTAAEIGSVMIGSTPGAGARVTFSMTDPNGQVSTKIVTADSNGKAAWNYKIGAKGPLGTYTVIASAIYNSASATSSPATFTVR